MTTMCMTNKYTSCITRYVQICDISVLSTNSENSMTYKCLLLDNIKNDKK